MRNYFLLLFTFLAIILAKLAPLSWIVGSQEAFFSQTTSISLFLSQYNNFWIIALLVVSLKANTLLDLFLSVFNRMPLFFGILAYRTQSFFNLVIVPFLCFFFFVGNPVGQEAWLYTLYWLIPVGIYFLKKEHFVLNAVASVFVTHAVGSVIWMYTHTMTSQMWIALIPLVALERLSMTLSIVSLELLATIWYKALKKIKLYTAGKYI